MPTRRSLSVAPRQSKKSGRRRRRSEEWEEGGAFRFTCMVPVDEGIRPPVIIQDINIVPIPWIWCPLCAWYEISESVDRDWR